MQGSKTLFEFEEAFPFYMSEWYNKDKSYVFNVLTGQREGGYYKHFSTAQALVSVLNAEYGKNIFVAKQGTFDND